MSRRPTRSLFIGLALLLGLAACSGNPQCREGAIGRFACDPTAAPHLAMGRVAASASVSAI